MLSDKDISALITSASSWEIAGYIFAALVTLACAGEGIHEFAPALNSKCEWWGKNGGKASILLLIAALALEIPTQFKINSINATIIGLLSEQTANSRLEEARLKAALTWRNLSLEDTQKVADVLRGIKGHVRLSFVSADPEAISFAWRLATAFKFANVDANAIDWKVQMSPRLDFDQVILDLHVPDPPTTQTLLIRKALDSVHIQYVTTPVPPPNTAIGAFQVDANDPFDAVITVGSRRPF